jgi:hypothetical protein
VKLGQTIVTSKAKKEISCACGGELRFSTQQSFAVFK